MNRYQKVKKEVLERISPSKEETKEIDKYLKEFLKKTQKRIDLLKLKVKIFVGGSYAKKTLIKKDKYDVDIYFRFNSDFEEKEISEKTKKILCDYNYSVLHGSRDYFGIKITTDLTLEIVPVRNLKKYEKSGNITDLSYAHVKYIKKKVKNKKVLEEIKIAKAFCYANKCYGAESYIQGFSGYSLELLVLHYKTFEKFLSAMIIPKEKIIIDIERDFKKKGDILLDLNSSKLQSPIILIDPTFPTRNVSAALSSETFEKFRKKAREFLKNPSLEKFILKKEKEEEIRKRLRKKKGDFVKIKITTDKQEGDIAGTKLLKFSKELFREISKYFIIKNRIFEYSGKKSADLFVLATPRKEVIFMGPGIKDKKNVELFKKEHSNFSISKGRIYSKKKIEDSLRKFLEKWKIKNLRKIKEMYIKEIVFSE
jgi:tRNA nucleotidyltransferase (CCA-adding enzyme)